MQPACAPAALVDAWRGPRGARRGLRGAERDGTAARAARCGTYGDLPVEEARNGGGRGLAYDPADRFPTTLDLAAALTDWLAGAG